MPKRLHSILEWFVIALMLLGIVGMFQPWLIDLYTWGFPLLFFSTLAFIVISHVSVREEEAA